MIKLRRDFLAEGPDLGHDAVQSEAAHVNGHGRAAGRADTAALAGGGDSAGLALAVVILVDVDGLIGAEGLAGGAADALLRVNLGDDGRRRDRAFGQRMAGTSGSGLRLSDGLVHAARRMRQAADIGAVHRQINRLQLNVRL